MKTWLTLLVLCASLAFTADSAPQPRGWQVQLARATSFDDSVVGEAATTSPNYRAYLVGRAQADSASREWLLSHGTPAGRLYAALLLREAGGRAGFQSLLQDHSKVKFRSGCEVIETTVAEVAQGFARAGNYLGFTGPPRQWRPWKSGKMLAILVENQLYTTPAHELFIHVAIRNNAHKAIGIDPAYSISINQWGSADEPKRVVVDERRIPYKPLSQVESDELARRFKAGKLKTIPPGQSYNFFVRFNGGAAASEVDNRPEKFLILSLDGQIRVSDGNQGESLGRQDSEVSETDIAFALPVHWLPKPGQ